MFFFWSWGLIRLSCFWLLFNTLSSPDSISKIEQVKQKTSSESGLQTKYYFWFWFWKLVWIQSESWLIEPVFLKINFVNFLISFGIFFHLKKSVNLSNSSNFLANFLEILETSNLFIYFFKILLVINPNHNWQLTQGKLQLKIEFHMNFPLGWKNSLCNVWHPKITFIVSNIYKTFERRQYQQWHTEDALSCVVPAFDTCCKAFVSFHKGNHFLAL
jgi:hypothetical protein